MFVCYVRVPCAAMERSALGGLSAYPDHTPGNPTESSYVAEYGEMTLRPAAEGTSYVVPAAYVPEYGQHATIGQGHSVNLDNRKVTVLNHSDFVDYCQPESAGHDRPQGQAQAQAQAQAHEQQGRADTRNRVASSAGTGESVVTSDNRVTYSTFPGIGAKPQEAKHRHDLARAPPIPSRLTINTTGAPPIPTRIAIHTAQNGSRTMAVPGADVGESTVDGDDDGYAHPISPRRQSGPIFTTFAAKQAAKQWACTLLVAPLAAVSVGLSFLWSGTIVHKRLPVQTIPVSHVCLMSESAFSFAYCGCR